ncbi:HpcH/HpaI aldolase family protein [Falsiroseomonas sp.]|uniref:HpcH/HpaI aldolase family protein n=1 Tax=unclassified Falsiroseomonas TaxID=2870720 RepID=UPI002723DD13|nr:aldolase/citrate lyase family protein [Falsiroseomonas sp.]MDO9501741.1 aldolase/citrate lyase family protein [Falsiroseomonas sp.]MDP3415327.1 aldolase/citrate lyase family protein [Falsiroseomonas sp.]
MANGVKAAWAAGKPVVNGWLAIPSGFTAEVMALAGWDSLTVDIQHGLQDYMSMVACFQGMQPHGVTPMVRVPWNEPGIIGKVLDGGAKGVICPMVNTEAEARALVSYCRYPNKGTRSFGPIRSGMYGAAADTNAANEDVLVIPMIETKTAVDNLEAIVNVPGVDAIYIGPSDLSLSLGMAPLQDRQEPEFLAVLDKIRNTAQAAGVKVGIHTMTGAYSKQMFERGFNLATIMNDSGLMLTAAKAQVAIARG